MATPNTLEHNNWLTVGEALLVTKTVLEHYIQNVVSHWHQMLLKRLKKAGPCASPAKCEPPAFLCRSCKVWYYELCKHHKGDSKKISWNNTNCTKWAQQSQGAWEVAKVFMANLGKMKSQVIDAKSTDIAGLLNILRFYPDEAFRGNPVSRPGRQTIEDVTNHARNPWAHSAKQEMTTKEKEKSLKSLTLFLKENALKSESGVGEGLNGLQKLDSDGITNISISESNCLKLLALELPAKVDQIKDEVKALKSTLNLQEYDISQVKSTISDISSSVERMLKNNSCETQQQRSDLQVLREDVCELEQAVETKLANLEKNQKHLEVRQDRLEENRRISEKINLDAACEPLQSRLPDFQDKVFGRDADIENAANLIRHVQKPCVVLTGAPGFGKTTVAINLAHELKTSKVCLFQSLREMRLRKDVCSALLAQVGQHPKDNEMEELLHWARSLKEEVVFILDNAEDVLQNDKDAFCDLLQNLRNINSRFIQFVITSRERFALSTMEVTAVEIKELNTEKGIEVIRSMIPEGNICGDSETFTELVNLCGGIPLALRMIGSILDCVDVTSLIQELKSFPMETLEDTTLPSYHQSIRAAFECSFQKLDKSLQAKLVRLSVFRGPFTQQAAASILDCQKRHALAGKVLRELTNKSLLTKLDDSDKRYEMHSLIQKYLMDVKREPYQNDFVDATSKFIDYYTSVIIEGHKLFWSKDEFKRSIEMFRSDNLNIEIALEMCYQDAEKMQTFFSNVWSVSMYLEMCVSLEKLNKFLESCSSSAATQNKNGVEMGAQCFLAYYEWKKAGDSEKYQTLFNNAKKLYEEEEKSLCPSQKWLYKHSYGMLLDQKKEFDKAFQVTNEAEQIAESNTDTTDLALTLNQLGIIEKHRKNYREAELWLTKGHEKRKEVLGEDHILSVPKHLADLYLQQGKHAKALVLYEKGLHTYKAIDMDKEKQCIYLLKNMGACCFQLEEVDKSLEYFHKAMELAERRLYGDQKVKVLLYSELANVCSKQNASQTREYAQNALEMAKRLEMWWGGKQQTENIMKQLDEAEKAD
ncbi:uncharacterized protein LOC116300283 [Actinia tenebrosa]|uniref:Uncharacterized protein LOC116300283 n=1 Tax=Actinia tenebrosa TaxID=6105 RepID=A0A6P8IEY8_ACTTE|nr:uncharacterized protein LOC116300283 [Actinia tenebrosa]